MATHEMMVVAFVEGNIRRAGDELAIATKHCCLQSLEDENWASLHSSLKRSMLILERALVEVIAVRAAATERAANEMDAAIREGDASTDHERKGA